MTELTTAYEKPTALQIAGQVANKHAENAVFADYLSRKSDNTIRTHAAALATFADYLTAAGIPGIDADCLQRDPNCWRGVTWGIVEAFVKWQLSEGYAVATVNNRLSVIKTYAKLATKAGQIETKEYQLIRTVSGYGQKEAKRIDGRRDVTRVGSKKAEHVKLSVSDAHQLKDWMIYEGDQGTRDCLLMCLLLDHGLRVGEIARLQVSDFDRSNGEFSFYRPKVDKIQTHKMTGDTLRALYAYLNATGRKGGRLLVGSRKGGHLTDTPMSERAISKRVAYLGKELLGITKERRVKVADTPNGPIYRTEYVGALSPHDCRHYWATDAARNDTDAFKLRDAGGWSSLAMPSRYVEAAAVANEGVKLSA